LLESVTLQKSAGSIMRLRKHKIYGKKVELADRHISEGSVAKAIKLYKNIADALIKKSKSRKRKKGPSVKAISTAFESNRRRH
jgi:hypothetical protein